MRHNSMRGKGRSAVIALERSEIAPLKPERGGREHFFQPERGGRGRHYSLRGDGEGV